MGACFLAPLLLKCRTQVGVITEIQPVYGCENILKSLTIIILFFFCILLPATSGPSDYKPIVSYTLPADIMRVELGTETWVYRLYEDGTVRKIVSERIYVAGEDKTVNKDMS